MKTSNTIFTKACMVLAATALVNVSCTDDFLKQDPLSFYNPENTYTTESGLQSALAMCDYGLKEMLIDVYKRQSRREMPPLVLIHI